MSESTNKAKLFAKMVRVMELTDQRIPKRGRNDYHKYDYAEASDVADVIRSALVEAGLAFYMGLNSVNYEKGITSAIFNMTLGDAETGESITVPWPAQAQDTQDKGPNKAGTAAQKYFLLRTFVVATGDEPDPDGSPAGSKPNKDKRQQPRPSEPGNGHKKAGRPLAPKALRRVMLKKAEDGFDGPASDGQIKFAASSLKKVVGNDEDRYKLLDFFFNKESTKDLSGGQASALIDWVGAKKENEWKPNLFSVQEAGEILLSLAMDKTENGYGEATTPTDEEAAELAEELGGVVVPVGIDELDPGDFYQAVREMEVAGDRPYKGRRGSLLGKLLIELTNHSKPFAAHPNRTLWTMLWEHALTGEEEE